MKPWTRRRFLRAAGIYGAAGAMLPFLPTFGSAQPSDNRKLLLITTGNGSVLPHWRPKRDGAELATGDSLDSTTSRILAPILERHASRTIVIDGLDMAAKMNEDGVIEDGGGHGSHQTIWTGRHQDGEAYDGPGAADGILPGGPSIDQIVADRIGMDTAIHSLQMGLWRNNRVDNRFVGSYSGDAQPLLTEHDVTVLYERLFGGFTPGEVDRTPDRRRQSLSVLRGELQRLRAQLPHADQLALDHHVDAFAAFESRLDAAAFTCDPGVLPSASTLNERADAHRWLIGQALACGRTRVATYNLTREVNWVREEDLPTFLPGWSGSTGEIHNSSHASRTSASAAEDITLLKEWEARWVADLLDFMQATPDGEGTLLDNTVVVWCTAMSHGGQHIVRNTPAVVVHGANGPWTTNQYVRSPNATAPLSMADWTSNSREFRAALGNGFPNNQLLVSIGQAFGLDMNQFGDARFEGALEELNR